MKKRFFLIIAILLLTIFAISFTACTVVTEKEKEVKTVTVLDDRFDLTNQVLNFIEELYYDDVDYDLADLYVAYGLVSSLGNYNYINSIADLLASTSDGKGFGLIVRTTKYNEHLIDSILEGSPFLTPSNGRTAQRGDEIYAINGTRLTGLASSAYASFISSLPSDEQVTFTLKRGEEVFDVSYEKIAFHFPNCYYVNDLPGVPEEMGYICLRSFDGNTSTVEEFTKAVKAFNEDGNSALILDLRGNGGGSSDVFAQVASALIGNVSAGETLLEIHYEKYNQSQYAKSVAVANKISTPVYVLCDGSTASASEALIGTMKAHGALTALIGQNTVGKGVAQNGVGLSENATGYFVDKGFDEEGKESQIGAYLVQVIVGKYYIIDPSAEDGKYCMHGQPFEPDIPITKENVISPDYSEDLYIAAAIDHYNENKKS